MTQNNPLKYLRHTVAASFIAATVFMACDKEDKSGKVPAKAVITGEAANECPAVSVILTASAEGAQSYLWYRNTFAIENANASTYAAISSGTYYATGVNTTGQGEKSEGKGVIISLNCPPAAPDLTGPTSNICPDLKLRLTAAAEHVETYIWYKGTEVIPGATTDFYDVTESGVYSVAAENAYGKSAKSQKKNVTISQCPPPAPTISGSHENACPETTVVLTAASEGATSYQWYRYDERLTGATASTYMVTTTGGYYATAANTVGTSEKTANAYVVYIDLCSAAYSYADLLGTYHAGGTPSIWGTPGSSTWTSVFSAGSVTSYYAIRPFADFKTPDDESPPIYLEAGISEDKATIAFAVNTQRALGTEPAMDGATGFSKTYTAYFEAFFIGGGSVYWFNTQYYQAFWDPATKTLDFSGVYKHDGVDYDIIVAVLARTDIKNKKWEASFTDGYKRCKFVKNGPSGAPAFTGERVTLPKLNGQTGGAAALKSVTIDFDPAKFSRKR
ncbi:MAG: hypothetical protein LBT49_04465 [Prevotellaceae bacterium]|jgi:hypothetical protein|nr:hypothetical protein [Prevotellaceae bacterium]